LAQGESFAAGSEKDWWVIPADLDKGDRGGKRRAERLTEKMEERGMTGESAYGRRSGSVRSRLG